MRKKGEKRALFSPPVFRISPRKMRPILLENGRAKHVLLLPYKATFPGDYALPSLTPQCLTLGATGSASALRGGLKTQVVKDQTSSRPSCLTLVESPWESFRNNAAGEKPGLR
jgi:hypothetical protein